VTREGVVITGAGVVAPLGSGAGLWTRYRAGARATGAVAELPLGALPDAVRTRAARAERVTQLLLATGGAALAGAGLDVTEGPPRPALGVVVGTAFGCFLSNAAFERRFLEGGAAAASPRLFAATVSNAAAGELAIAYRLGGPSVTVTAGGASGLVACGHALDLLRAGRAAALVAGGVDALGDDLAAWLAAGGLPIGRAASEAAALVVLEPAASARARGATVLGTIAGSGVGFEPTADGEGLRDTIAAALADAELAAGAVDLCVRAAPPALEAMETRALETALGRLPARTVRPKDLVGDTLGAAGPLGLLAALGEAPDGATVLVLDVCPSGHVAALVARRGAAA